MGRAHPAGTGPVDGNMDRSTRYEIRVEGTVTDRWSEWFDGLTIRNEADGETTLVGTLPDQAALFGVLNKIHALNLSLISVVKCRDHVEK